jgi:hypothetical protein
MQKIPIRLTRVFAGSFRGLYFILSIAAILFWTYLFGHPILEGNIAGSDSAYALSLISWIDRWFPILPAWYPLQGAGSSGILMYPFAAHYFVVLASRLTGLSLTQAFRLTQLASVAATSCGIYVLAWKKLQSQTIALISGLLYPISMAAWKWGAGIGVFGQSVSFALVAPTFLLFDEYMLNRLGHPQRIRGWRSRLILMASAIAFCMMIMTHLITAIVFGMTILLYSLLIPMAQDKGGRALATIENLKRSMIGIVLGLLLASFWLMPFVHIRSQVNRQGPVTELGLNQVPTLDLLAMMGLVEQPATKSLYAVTFASPVLILASVGLVLSIRRRRFVLVLAIITISFAIFTAMPGALAGLIKPLARLWAILYGRATIPTIIFLPIVAGYGAVELSRCLIDAPGVLIRFRTTGEWAPEPGLIRWSTLKSFLAGLLGIIVTVVVFIYLRHAPPGYKNYQGYGHVGGDAWQPFEFKGNVIENIRWPSFSISSSEWPNAGRTASELTEILHLKANRRIYSSIYFGGVLEALPLYSDVSTVSMYYYQGKLNSPMLGYMAETYWNSEYGSSHEVDEFAKWLGVDYVVLSKDLDPLEKYDGGNWHTVALPDDKGLENIAVRGFNDPTGIASVLTAPEILVIGGFEKKAYEQIFRLFNSGLVEYDQAIIVEGGHRIDDYSKEELSHFELVFLHGYGYRNRDRAWDLLTEYVQAGGSLYIDTGWQYMVPDWEMDEAPSLLPVSNLVWTSVHSTEQLFIPQDADWISIDAEQFAPMMWGNQPWGVSSPSGSLRNWATPVLFASNKPLVAAGQYGKGRVVWSGMNLVGHINRYQDSEERAFLQDLILWLLPRSGADRYEKPEIRREHPDSVTLTIPGPVSEGTNLLWRENHTPDWRASAEINGVEEEIEIYRAGPGMMLMHLPPSQEETMVVTMEYSLAGVRGIGIGVTALIGILLLAVSTLQSDPIKVLLGWLPKPFLKERSNKQWGERKHFEIKEEIMGSEVSDEGGNGIEGKIAANSGHVANGDASMPDGPLQSIEMPFKFDKSSNSIATLSDLLNTMSHSEDLWVDKVLNRRKAR